MQAGTQYFRLKEKVRASHIKFMKFDVLSTFQQQNETTTAYMNQILVFEKMPEEAELADKSH
jgi:hypothetical protein